MASGWDQNPFVKSSPAGNGSPRSSEANDNEGRLRNEAKALCVQKTLSELSREISSATVFDVARFVHRPVSVRRREGLEHGKVKRPLNDFVLYRKAYSAVVLAHLKGEGYRNSQQLVSQICGASWKKEGDEVKKRFKELASIEREKHGEAFPRYRYAPRQGKRSQGERCSMARLPRRQRFATLTSLNQQRQAGQDPAPKGETFISQDAIRGHLEKATVKVGGPRQHYPFMQDQEGWYSLESGTVSTACEDTQSNATDEIKKPVGLQGLAQEGGMAGDRMLETATSASLHSLTQSAEMDLSISLGNWDFCIDPSLLPMIKEDSWDEYRASNDNINNNQLWQLERGEATSAMPYSGFAGANDAFLGGPAIDWRLNRLGGIGHSMDCMAWGSETRSEIRQPAVTPIDLLACYSSVSGEGFIRRPAVGKQSAEGQSVSGKVGLDLYVS